MARALVNANVHTMTQPEARAEAILWDGDTIQAVGTRQDIEEMARAKGIQTEDAGGRVVLPGFVDAHMHLMHVGIKRTRPDLRGASSKAEALQRCRDWLAAHPDGDVIGEGWDEAEWGGDAPPTRDELDAICPDRRFVLRRICGHKAVANSMALPSLREHWPDERVDLETGVLLEEPSLYLNEVIPADRETLDRAIPEACRVAHHLGVTTVGDYEQWPLREALLRAARDGRLGVRVHCSVYAQALDDAVKDGFCSGRAVRAAGIMAPQLYQDRQPSVRGAQEDPRSMLRDGGLKIFLDGSLGGHTARMLEPYDDRPDSRGRKIWSDDELDRLMGRAHAHGIQIHAHAIGDGAVEQGLRAFERLAEAVGSLSLPGPDGVRLAHRFEHFEIVHDDQLARAAKLGLWASSQPNFVGAWSSHGGMYEERIGKRFALNNRFRSFKKAGLRIAFGSDGMPFGPLVGIQSAIEHPVPEERLDVATAVWHYTHEAAASLGRHDLGHLVPGARSDLLILDVHELDERPPKQWVIQETIQEGQTVCTNDAPCPDDDHVAPLAPLATA